MLFVTCEASAASLMFRISDDMVVLFYIVLCASVYYFAVIWSQIKKMLFVDDSILGISADCVRPSVRPPHSRISRTTQPIVMRDVRAHSIEQGHTRKVSFVICEQNPLAANLRYLLRLFAAGLSIPIPNSRS